MSITEHLNCPGEEEGDKVQKMFRGGRQQNMTEETVSKSELWWKKGLQRELENLGSKSQSSTGYRDDHIVRRSLQ